MTGDAGFAQSSSEAGTRWFDRQGHGWRNTLRKISTNADGGFELHLKHMAFRYDHRGIDEGSYECTN